jgi:hypothetical protein
MKEGFRLKKKAKKTYYTCMPNARYVWRFIEGIKGCDAFNVKHKVWTKGAFATPFKFVTATQISTQKAFALIGKENFHGTVEEKKDERANFS